MGRLKGLNANLGLVRQRLADAEKNTGVREQQLDSVFDIGFNKVSDRLQGSLGRLMTESDAIQSKTLQKAVDSVVRGVADTHGIFRQGLAQISQELALSHNILSDEVQSITIDGTLAGRIEAVGETVKNLRFPVTKPTDLSGVLAAISGIPTPDLAPQLEVLAESIQARLDRRIHTFEIIRDPISGLIEKVVVTET